MTSLQDEVITLKHRVGTLEERQDLEAGLAASRDRDLSVLGVKLKQLEPMFQGLQERLAEEAQTFKQHAARFNAVDQVLSQHTARFDVMDQVLSQHTARLVALERGQIELKQGQDQLRQGQDQLKQGQDQLREDLQTGLAELNGGQRALIALLTRMFDRPKTAE